MWIPVGTYKTSSGNKQNNLSRRTFTSTGSTEVETDSVIDNNYYGEGATMDEYGEPITTIAKDQIGAFKTSATTKGGFYIGRYEQGMGNVCKAGLEPYDNITRNQAKTYSEDMYRGNTYVTSELISSYAWDTALNFICQINGYNLATTTNNESANIKTGIPTKTGEYSVNGKIVDKYSNIYDFLGNREEWTTEYSRYFSSGYEPAVLRGATYDNWNSAYAAYRHNFAAIVTSNEGGFRIQLYIK